MTHWLVIPFRGPEGAKSRLAPALSDRARHELAATMFSHVLAVCLRAARDRAIADGVLVVTPSPQAASMATAVGATVLTEATGSLNAALAAARRHLLDRAVTTATIVAADLPLLDVDDLVAMRPAADTVLLAPDRAGAGTNALTLPLVAPFRFSFGPHSLAAHEKQSAACALTATIIPRPGLASDIDVPDDLAVLTDGTHHRSTSNGRSAA